MSKIKLNFRKDKNYGRYQRATQVEIDLVIEENGVLYPIETKKKDHPDVYDATAFDVLDKEVAKKRGMGIIFSSAKTRVQLKDELICLPLSYI